MSNFQPVVVDDFCAVRASFHQPIRGVEHEIIITPKMSFGTGHHATTYMMMQQMREINFQDQSVFDFGTGTGVLAILAEKLGSPSVTAIDVDDWSIINAGENITTNHCHKIHLYKSSRVPHQQFDIILANINRNVIIQNFNEIINAAKPGSSILFSGLLTADESDIVKEAHSRNINLIKQVSKNNWVCLLFVK
jgi:ribosomal protein L11 methyltransferase